MAEALNLGARSRWDSLLIQVAGSYNPARGDALLPDSDPARVRAAEDAMLEAVAGLRDLFPGSWDGDRHPGRAAALPGRLSDRPLRQCHREEEGAAADRIRAPPGRGLRAFPGPRPPPGALRGLPGGHQPDGRQAGLRLPPAAASRNGTARGPCWRPSSGGSTPSAADRRPSGGSWRPRPSPISGGRSWACAAGPRPTSVRRASSASTT